MVRRFGSGALGSIVLVFALAGCSGGASPSSSSSEAAALPSAAAPSVAAPSAPESSVATASGPVPGFSLPSEVKDLEALLPSTMCGSTSTKASVTGASFAQTGQSEMLDALKAIGKTVDDVTFAIAIGADSGCTAGILRVQGVDENTLKNAIIQAAQKSGQTATQKSVGGKDVYVTAEGSGSSYAYFHGDAMIFASAKNDDQAASILKDLP